MDIFGQYTSKFLLVLLRVGIFMSLLPFFGSKNFPAQFKIGLALAIALVLTSVVQIEITTISIPVLVIREVVFGIMLGALVRFVFFAVDMAGQMMSNATGLSIATVFNPEMGQTSEVSRLYGIIAMLILLAADAHHDLIYLLVRSYEWIPVGQFDLRDLIPGFVAAGNRIFIIALRIAAPVLVIMVIANLLTGFINKAAPQANIFFISFPVYIFIGFLVMLITVPVFAHVISISFSEIRDEMYRIMAAAKG